MWPCLQVLRISHCFCFDINERDLASLRHLKTSLFACAAVCQVAPTHIHRHGDLLSRLFLYIIDIYIYIFVQLYFDHTYMGSWNSKQKCFAHMCGEPSQQTLWVWRHCVLNQREIPVNFVVLMYHWHVSQYCSNEAGCINTSVTILHLQKDCSPQKELPQIACKPDAGRPVR